MASSALLSSTSTSPLFPNPTPRTPLLPLQLRLPISPSPFHIRPILLTLARASSAAPSPTITPASSHPFLSESTRTVTSLLLVAFALANKLGSALLAPSAAEVAKLASLRGGFLASAAGPLFFAAVRDRPSGYLNTPLTVVAAGMSRWLDIYSGVLMIRVLLSWFPNIPWDRQPLSAIRDLCDPYLNLFRNIIPPIFDTLDVSPLLAFAVLGTLGSILNNSRGVY